MMLAQVRRRRRGAIAQALAAVTLAFLVLTPRMDQDTMDSQEPTSQAVLADAAPDLPNPS